MPKRQHKKFVIDSTPYEDRPYSKREVNEFFRIKDKGWKVTDFLSARSGRNWFTATAMAKRMHKQGIINIPDIYDAEWEYF